MENEVLLLLLKLGIEIEDEVFLQKFLVYGIEGREKYFLIEYIKVFRNYKEVKKMLEEIEIRFKSENILKDE